MSAADYIRILPVENEETIIKAFKKGIILKETFIHKLSNLPMMTFERLKILEKDEENKT